VHFARDNYYPNNSILQEVPSLTNKAEASSHSTEKEQLIYLRNIQIKNSNFI